MPLRLLPLLLLVACAPVRRIDKLAAAGWRGEACHEAVEREVGLTQGLIRSHQPGVPIVRARVADALADAPEYGQTWAVVELEAEVGDVRAPVHSLIVDVPGWARCPPDKCDAAWLERKIQGPRPKASGGGLARALGGLIKGVATVITLPIALTVDAVTAIPRALTPRRRRGPTATESLMRALGQGTTGPPTLSESPMQLVCDGSGTCAGTQILLRADTESLDAPVVGWQWHHSGCTVGAAWTLPGDPTDQLDARLRQELTELDLASRPPSHWWVDGS